MAKSVYISPSTQEKNIGALNYGTEEYRMNQIADVVCSELKRHGIIVYRNKQTFSLAQAIEDSNDKKADIHFAIHSNAYNKISRGCEIFCYKFGSLGHKLAKLVYARVAAITPTSDRGVKEGYNFYGKGKSMAEVEKTTMPAALIEISFHDNPEDAKWIIDHIKVIAIEIVKGILEYFGMKYIEEKLDRVLYKVQVGAFSEKTNAEDLKNRLKKAGYDAFITINKQ